MSFLTEKQEAVLKYIENYQLKNGRSPTLREMRENFGVSSDNSILKHLKALEEKGFIKKDGSSRGISMLDNIKERLQANFISIPILGFVPAGGPILSEEHVEGYMNFSESDVFKPENSFILRVRGDSMVDAGIFDGDLVVACSAKEPRKNDIVIALVDNENTVKRYCRDGSQVFLKAENPDYSDIYPESELCVQGVVTALIRNYL